MACGAFEFAGRSKSAPRARGEHALVPGKRRTERILEGSFVDPRHAAGGRYDYGRDPRGFFYEPAALRADCRESFAPSGLDVEPSNGPGASLPLVSGSRQGQPVGDEAPGQGEAVEHGAFELKVVAERRDATVREPLRECVFVKVFFLFGPVAGLEHLG